MDKIFEKISNYHFFNTIIPGVCVVYLSKVFFDVDFLTDEIVYNILIVFIFGLFSGRIGSVIIEPILKRFKIICFEDYDVYLNAIKKDEKIQELVVDNNLYRAMIAAFVFLLIEKLYLFLNSKIVFLQKYGFIVISIFVIVIFVFSYRKQTKYISKRINGTNNSK